MATEQNTSSSSQGGGVQAVLLSGPDGAHYLIPVGAFEAFRLSEDRLESLGAGGEVEGYFYNRDPWYLTRLSLEGMAASAWAGVTGLVSGSGSKFEADDRGVVVGVRG